MKEIYLDNAAATTIDPGAIKAMHKAQREFANPSSFNDAGRRAKALLEKARTDVARFLNARTSEVVFCSSGSEANTLAIIGLGAATYPKGHLITTTIEHKSVLEPMRSLEKWGWEVSYAPVSDEGIVDVDTLENLITDHTRLVSVMYANNEIGSIQPIKKIAAMIRRWRKEHRTAYPYLHVDACQATAWLPMDVQALGVDLLALNGAKVHGPHSSAVLYVRRGVVLAPQILGGSQEYGLRAGSEDVASAVGLAVALGRVKAGDADRVLKLRDHLISGVQKIIPDAHVNGATGKSRLANNVNISVSDADSENLLLELDRHSIRAGAGSACTAHAVEPSHVLKAIATPKKYLAGALRFTLSRHTTKKEIDAVLQILPTIISHVRSRFIK